MMSHRLTQNVVQEPLLPRYSNFLAWLEKPQIFFLNATSFIKILFVDDQIC
jgi:hypothetical protein